MAYLVRRNNSYGYTKMEKEDPQERSHREAQFLIYKTMKQANQIMLKRSRSSKLAWLKLRASKLKMKIGKGLIRLRKTMLSTMSKTKVGVCKTFKRLFRGGVRGGGAINHLHQPLFT